MNKNKSKLKKVIKKNKKILLILGSVLIIALIAFIILFATRIKKERVVIKEVDKINELDVSKDEIDMEIKSSGELAIVEQSIKNYYKDFFALKKTLNDNRAEALLNILTPEYLNKNKKKLSDVKKEFETKNTAFEDNVDNLIEMLKDYKIISYIDKTKISKHNYEFYKSLMITEDDKVIMKDLEDMKKDNKLYIDGKDILNEYNELRNKVYDLKESK